MGKLKETQEGLAIDMGIYRLWCDVDAVVSELDSDKAHVCARELG